MALRRAIIFTMLFVVSCILLFGSIYQHMATWERTRIKKLLEEEAYAFSQASEDQLHWSINKHVYIDRHQMTFSALFDSDLRYIEGNVNTFPRSLPADGVAHELDSIEIHTGQPSEPIIFVALRLRNSRVLLIGRTIQDLDNLWEAVLEALKFGLLSIALPVIVVGVIFSQRMSQRLRSAQKILTSFQEGQLRQRLPVSGSADELDLLSAQVNSTLNELERVVNELHHAGNNIAHDLRTPLARVQASLENAQRLMAESDPAFGWVDQAIVGLGQAFALTTALLRVAHVESGKARASFKLVDLSKLVTEVADLYGPVAEARQIALDVGIGPAPFVMGDRDLLLEALANLLDNAIKFSPERGSVKISLAKWASGAVVSVVDSGPGISESERTEIFKRFYRCARSRHIPGNGLGLALVAAIARLHNFSIEVKDGSPGSIFELHCVVPLAARCDGKTPERKWSKHFSRKNGSHISLRPKSQIPSSFAREENSSNEFTDTRLSVVIPLAAPSMPPFNHPLGGRMSRRQILPGAVLPRDLRPLASTFKLRRRIKASTLSACRRSPSVRGVVSGILKQQRAPANASAVTLPDLLRWLERFFRAGRRALAAIRSNGWSVAFSLLLMSSAVLCHSVGAATGRSRDEGGQIDESRGVDSVLEKIASLRRELKELARERDPLLWAMTENDLGAALLILGQRERDPKQFEDAIAAFREALQELTLEQSPAQWGMAQNNLATALATLGERENDAEKLEEAVNDYRDVLKEFTRERVPAQWASTQFSLGNTLVKLGQRESGTARLEEAVAAYREVLKEKTRARVPLEWANAQSSLGIALLNIGERTNGTVELEEAVAAYRAALEEFTREHSPMEWAAAQNNLGNALARIGRRKIDSSKLEGAVAAYREALKEFTRERTPIEWAAIQNDLGSALFELGEKESGTSNLEAAVVALREALKELTNESSPYYHSLALKNLNQASALLAQRRHDATHGRDRRSRR